MCRTKSRTKKVGGVSLVLVLAAFSAGLAGCGGAVEPDPPGSAGNGLGSSGAGGAGSSSGAATGSSSGATGSSGASSGTASSGASSGGSSSGVSTGSSSGAGSCSDLPVPDIAEECADGSYVGAVYVDEGGQCVLTFPCPPTPSPSPAPTPTPTPSPPVPPTPECNGALPDICEICSDGVTRCAHFVVEDGQCVTQICPSGTGSVNPGGPIVVSPPAEPTSM